MNHFGIWLTEKMLDAGEVLQEKNRRRRAAEPLVSSRSNPSRASSIPRNFDFLLPQSPHSLIN